MIAKYYSLKFCMKYLISYAICISIVCVKHWAPSRGTTKNNHLILIMCPPPRKSLVKGERFIRSEGRPE